MKKRGGMVLADVPERVALRELRGELTARRDQIAEIDLEIETLREDLASFEAEYHRRLAVENDTLTRVRDISRHLERWADLLARATRQELAQGAKSIERRREQETQRVTERRWSQRYTDNEVLPEPPAPLTLSKVMAEEEPARRDQLKEAYRALARRYHPDLARTEEERLENSKWMVRINALYRDGDLDRLRALAEQAKGAEIDDPELDVTGQLQALEERLAWFDAVLHNLQDERTSLEASSTCVMMRNVEQAQAHGRDLLGEIQVELQDHVRQAYKDIRKAVGLLEKNVSEFNRNGASGRPLTTRRKGEALQRVFDPFADKRLVRIGLDHVDRLEVSSSARKMGEWVQQTAEEDPATVRLLLLAHCAELSPFPLEGLESFEDIATRFTFLNRRTLNAGTLEEVLVKNDDLVEYGVRRATDKVVHMGLRYRTQEIRDAVLVALPDFGVRRLLREVLGVLSQRQTCGECRGEVFPVPLYKLRGLDNLRANVCPDCGHTLSSYWMPKGKDVQAVLNQTFLDFELISEWSCTLARASVAMQLVPVQQEKMTVGDLKTRLVQDVFTRQEIEVTPEQVHLHQDGVAVAEGTPLIELQQQSFVIRFDEDASVNEADALELVRHRIRNRFR